MDGWQQGQFCLIKCVNASRNYKYLTRRHPAKTTQKEMSKKERERNMLCAVISLPCVTRVREKTAFIAWNRWHSSSLFPLMRNVFWLVYVISDWCLRGSVFRVICLPTFQKGQTRITWLLHKVHPTLSIPVTNSQSITVCCISAFVNVPILENLQQVAHISRWPNEQISPRVDPAKCN